MAKGRWITRATLLSTMEHALLFYTIESATVAGRDPKERLPDAPSHAGRQGPGVGVAPKRRLQIGPVAAWPG